MDNNELVTMGYLKQTLGQGFSRVKKEFDAYCLKTNDKLAHHDKTFEMIFFKLREHDDRFDRMDAKLDKTIDIIQGLADKVVKDYQTFIVESASIHFNYKHLETRTKRLEEVVFPNK